MNGGAAGGRRSRGGTVLVVVFLIAFFGWGVTYIPGVQNVLPSLVSIEPTSRVPLSDVPASASTIPATMIEQSCHNIPFVMRPLAGGRAHTARIIFTQDGTDLGEIRFNCHTGAVLSDRQY